MGDKPQISISFAQQKLRYYGQNLPKSSEFAHKQYHVWVRVTLPERGHFSPRTHPHRHGHREHNNCTTPHSHHRTPVSPHTDEAQKRGDALSCAGAMCGSGSQVRHGMCSWCGVNAACTVQCVCVAVSQQCVCRVCVQCVCCVVCVRVCVSVCCSLPRSLLCFAWHEHAVCVCVGCTS